MLSIEEALALVAEHARPLAPRRVTLGEAAGLVVADDIVSDVDSPPFDKALMDGYAVISSDRQPEREVLEEIGAGSVPRRPVTPGTATRLMTGAPLPEGADAIIPVEKTERAGDRSVRLAKVDPEPGQHVLPMGASLKAGAVAIQRGVELRSIEIGLLAEIGQGVVNVLPRPRVAVLPTGNELVPIGEKPAAGQIRNSNGPMLVAALARAGADALELPIARDDRDQLRALIEQGLSSDVLLLCGGVSAGDFDLVPETLASLGIEQVFHKISLRPGKPLWFGVKRTKDRRVLVFGLPGNPVSSLVCCELFVRPAIAALSGRGFAPAPLHTARLSHGYRFKGGRAACLPSRVADWQSDNLTVEILPWQGSADLATLARANALARFGGDPVDLESGAKVIVARL
jgi:molybdopterin molybdotransferase